MTKILSDKIETLSPEKQSELLKYIDFLAAKKPNKRMTMDRMQNSNSVNAHSQDEHMTFVHYTIW